jgi:hypothetical protein
VAPLAPRHIGMLFIMLGLAAAGGAHYGYQQLVQAPACYEYARKKNLRDLDDLTFSSARIATKERRHVCYFYTPGGNAPVVLEFNPADIPSGRDAGEIAVTIGAFALFAGFGTWLAYRRARRH